MSEDICSRCGVATGETHLWVEGDCVLRHRAHSRASAGVCCAPCVDRITDWLAEIVDLFRDLPRVIPLGSVPDDTAKHRHVNAAASPAMMRLDAWSMWKDRSRLKFTGKRSDIPDVPSVLADLATRLHDDLGTVPAAPYGDDPGSAASFLTARVEDLARLPWVVEADADLRWLRSHLRRAHGLGEPQPLGRCMSVTEASECGGWVMPSTDRDPRPQCTRCHRRYGHLDLVRLKVMQ